MGSQYRGKGYDSAAGDKIALFWDAGGPLLIVYILSFILKIYYTFRILL
jgi:hypothetical protein